MSKIKANKYLIAGSAILIVVILLIIAIVISNSRNKKELLEIEALGQGNSEMTISETESLEEATQADEIIHEEEGELLYKDEQQPSPDLSSQKAPSQTNDSYSGEEIIILEDGSTISVSELEEAMSEAQELPEDSASSDENSENNQGSSGSTVIELPIIPIN